MEPTVASGYQYQGLTRIHYTVYLCCALSKCIFYFTISESFSKEAVQTLHDSLKSLSETQNPSRTCAFLSLGR